MRVAALIPFLSLIATAIASGQLPPIRPLGPIVATSTENLGSVPSVRGFADGRVLVSDMTRRRLFFLDSMLAHPEMVLTPTGAAATVFPARGGTLFALRGDTTLVLDAAGASFVVLDRAGKVVKVTAVPRVADLFYLSNANYGQPGIDSAGRLIYRTQPNPTGFNPTTGAMIIPDSAPILSVRFDTRRVDTIAFIKTPPSSPTVSTLDADGTRHFISITKPFELIDEWAMLPNGDVAIVRWKDYHVDWVEGGGKRKASAKTAWNWMRLTDDEKALFIDSLKARNLKADSLVNRANAGSPMKMAWETMTVSPSEVPDYPPPFIGRATRVDGEGRIWMLERGKLGVSSAGLVYDIIDREGQIVDRVQAPPNSAVIGFGNGGTVYLAVSTSNAMLASSIPPVVPPGAMMPGAPPPPPVKLAKAVLAKKP